MTYEDAIFLAFDQNIYALNNWVIAGDKPGEKHSIYNKDRSAIPICDEYLASWIPGEQLNFIFNTSSIILYTAWKSSDTSLFNSSSDWIELLSKSDKVTQD